jgi:hypothetical protein
MTGKRTGYALCGALLAGMSAPAMAETSQTDMAAELAELKAQVATMQAQQQDEWLTERRAEEIKGLVKEVLSDAETRSSLLAEGAMAGIDEKGSIFLQSADGSWKANIEGQIQFRYIWNENEGAAGADDESVDGFQMRRSKIKIKGHIADPKIYYQVVFAGDRDGPASTNVGFEDVYFGYKFDGGLYVQAGIFKLPFARQELISSSRQTAVDRSIVTEYFTMDRAEQVQIGYKGDMFTAMVSAHDGADNQFTDFTGDQAHSFGVTGRVDVKLMGEWDQAKDELAWSGDEGTALFIGAAGQWENNKDNAGAVANADSWYAVTVDALLEVNPFSVTGAYFFAEADNPAGVADLEAHGFYAQGAVNFDNTWAPFIRYNWLEQDPEGVGQDPLQAVTFGINYFLKKHDAKLTADVVYIFDGTSLDEVGDINGGELSSGLGLTGKTNDEDQLAVRVQFQLKF